ncbi:MAG TPA: exodeoxyribonuclease VII small subunit [Chloroflexota bacterium]
MSEAPDFEKILAELEAVVERLQRPDLPLEEAIGLYRRGTDLAQRAETLLGSAEIQVQQLTKAVQERFAEYNPDASGPDVSA